MNKNTLFISIFLDLISAVHESEWIRIVQFSNVEWCVRMHDEFYSVERSVGLSTSSFWKKLGIVSQHAASMQWDRIILLPKQAIITWSILKLLYMYLDLIFFCWYYHNHPGMYVLPVFLVWCTTLTTNIISNTGSVLYIYIYKCIS